MSVCKTSNCTHECAKYRSHCYGCISRIRKEKYKNDLHSSSNRLYFIWVNMRKRCQNIRCAQYKDYGGRGIRICTEWNMFDNFYNDMIDGYLPNLTLDRINNNGNYCKDNCRWASVKMQANNKRNNRVLTIGQKTLSLSQWSEVTGINRTTISMRLNKYGWSVKDSLTKGATL